MTVATQALASSLFSTGAVCASCVFDLITMPLDWNKHLMVEYFAEELLHLKTELIWEALMTVIFTLTAIPVSLMSLTQVRRFLT